jgi:hypothetical protein
MHLDTFAGANCSTDGCSACFHPIRSIDSVRIERFEYELMMFADEMDLKPGGRTPRKNCRPRLWLGLKRRVISRNQRPEEGLNRRQDE